jgi:hypothetical protein
VALEVAGSLENVVSRLAEVAVKRGLMRQILLEILGAASRSGRAEEPPRPLKGGLKLRAVLREGRREVLAYRKPGNASPLEADTVRRALDFACHPPVPFNARGDANGWHIAEILEDEIEAMRDEIKARNDAEHRSSRLDHAIGLLLELRPQHLDTVDGYVDLWREGLEQFPDKLEAKITAFTTELETKRRAALALPETLIHEAML